MLTYYRFYILSQSQNTKQKKHTHTHRANTTQGKKEKTFQLFKNGLTIMFSFSMLLFFLHFAFAFAVSFCSVSRRSVGMLYLLLVFALPKQKHAWVKANKKCYRFLFFSVSTPSCTKSKQIAYILVFRASHDQTIVDINSKTPRIPMRTLAKGNGENNVFIRQLNRIVYECRQR